MSTFGKRLEEALAEGSLSKREVARRVGASSHSRLDEWAAGKGSPTVAELVRLAEVLGVTVQWLARGEDPKRPIPLSAEIKGFRAMAKVVDRVRATPPNAPTVADDLQEKVRDTDGARTTEKEA